MVTCQLSKLGWEVTVELPADFQSLGRGSVRSCTGFMDDYVVFRYFGACILGFKPP